MSTTLEQRFWQLLTDYERLTQDESVAVRSRDFDSVDSLQARKSPLLEALCALAAKTGLNRQNAILSARLDALAGLETSSAKALARMLDEVRIERQNLDAARQRLRSLKPSYGPDPHAPQGFCAHG